MKRMRQRVLVLLLAAAMASSQCPAVLAEDLTDDQVETEGIRTEENVDQNTENPEEGTIPEESEETGETDKTTGTDGEDTGEESPAGEAGEQPGEPAGESRNVDLFSVTDPVETGTQVTVNGVVYEVTQVATESRSGKVVVTDGSAATGDVTIPAEMELDGLSYTVAELGDRAFQNNTALTGIDFSATSIKTVGQSCFAGCTALTTVKPSSDRNVYTVLERNAFQGCASLEEVTFPALQISKSCMPFSGSGLKTLTVLNVVRLSSNALSGLGEGFTLICPDKITVSQVDRAAFGTTKNVTVQVADEATKTSLESKFGSGVTVTLLGAEEEETAVLVQGPDGTLQGYATLELAFQAISSSEAEGSWKVTVRSGNGQIVWPSETAVPDKETVIDFSGNSVALPETLTLEAPLTIQNVLNFTNETLCTVEAGDHAFALDDGGSFGFREIRGSSLTFSGKLPGSTSMGEPCRITGTGENATVTFCNIGRSDYYYNLPVMEGISTLALDNAFLEGTAGEIAGVNSITMEKGGLTLLEGTAETGTLSGSGELRLENQASLAVTDQASGSFTLYGNADSSISVPEGSTDGFGNAAGQNVQIIEEKILATVTGGTLSGAEYISLEAAMEAIEADRAGNSTAAYQVTLQDDVTLSQNITLADCVITLDGAGHTIGAESGVQYICVPNSLTLENVALNLPETSIRYTPNTNRERTIEFAETAAGTLGGVLDDSQSRWLDVKVNGTALQIGKVTGTVSTIGTKLTDLLLYGQGTLENPVSLEGKAESLAAVSLNNSFLQLEGDVTDYGVIRTERGENTSGLILTGDTSVYGLSLRPTQQFGIRMPADSTLTVTSRSFTSVENIPITLTGTPEDGQILVKLDYPARGDGANFVLANTDIDGKLLWNEEEGTYTLHLHSYTWGSDGNNHWQTCQTCGETTVAEAHTGGTATCISPAVCEVCGASYGEKNPENHTGETEVRGYIEAKTGVEGYSGDIYCADCGVLLEEGHTIPALEDANQKPGGDASGTGGKTGDTKAQGTGNAGSPRTGDTSSPLGWLLLLLTSGTVALAGLFAKVSRRKR